MLTTLKIGIDLAFLLTGLTSGAEYRDLKEKGIVTDPLVVWRIRDRVLDCRDVEFKSNGHPGATLYTQSAPSIFND